MTTSPDEQQAAGPVARRGFNLGLPDGFIELPADRDDLESPELTEHLIAQVAEQFGLPSDGENATAAAAAFADLGILAGGGGVDYSAIAFYKSPDDPTRPIMILVTGIAMPSDHYGNDAAIAGLLEAHKAEGRGEPVAIQLPVGPAVALAVEEKNFLELGEEKFPILTRQFSAWVPDPDGTTVGVVSVMTNCWQDWDHVCVLATEIFDSFEWLELSST
jgi:hypothetical protein